MRPWGAALRAHMRSLCSAEASVCSPTSQLSQALILAQNPPCSSGASDLGKTLEMKTRPWGDPRGITSFWELRVRETESREDNCMSLNLSSLYTLSWSGLKQQQPFLTIQFSEALTYPGCLGYLSFQNSSFGPEFWLPCPDVLAQTFNPQPSPDSCEKQGHSPGLPSWIEHWHKQNLSKSREKIKQFS